MGLFWDLIQQSQISDQKSQSQTLESRIASLERQLHQTQGVLHSLIQRLEEKFGEDINGDGQIG